MGKRKRGTGTVRKRTDGRWEGRVVYDYDDKTVSFFDLPDKNSDEFGTVIELYKKKYISNLESVFGEDYACNRNVDRALWVYGHLFKRT